MKFYSLKGKSFDFFNRPFVAQDDLHAKALIRNVVISDETGEAKKQLADADLYFVGIFDQAKGKFKTCKPALVCSVKDIPLPKEVNS